MIKSLKTFKCGNISVFDLWSKISSEMYRLQIRRPESEIVRDAFSCLEFSVWFVSNLNPHRWVWGKQGGAEDRGRSPEEHRRLMVPPSGLTLPPEVLMWRTVSLSCRAWHQSCSSAVQRRGHWDRNSQVWDRDFRGGRPRKLETEGRSSASVSCELFCSSVFISAASFCCYRTSQSQSCTFNSTTYVWQL